MRIIGWGSALPDTIVPNSYFESVLDTSDRWIRERTGITERRHGGTTGGLAVAAAAGALAMADCSPTDVDLLVLATTTPDRQIPATSSLVSRGLGLRCGAFDLNAACAGFVYALVAAEGLTRIGYETILVVGAETLTRFTDMTDRSTAVLMADGAGAMVVTACADSRLLGYDLGCDGTAYDHMFAEIGSTMVMDGKEVYRRAVRYASASAQAALRQAKLTTDDVHLFVPHQANLRMMEAIAARLGLAPERVVVTVDTTGNTSAASIPIALDRAAASGRLAPGDIVLLTGFGAGMTWSSAVLQWS